jgi:hypothetical protein
MIALSLPLFSKKQFSSIKIDTIFPLLSISRLCIVPTSAGRDKMSACRQNG